MCKITIVIYSNCQANGIIPNLLLNMKDIHIEHITNYNLINNKSVLPIDLLKNCDVFIYQPIDIKHGIYSTDNICSFLPENVVKISFPYIYNSGIWGITKDSIRNDDGSIQGNRDIILKLKLNGKSLNEIIDLYLNNEIDFNYKYRFEQSIQKLRIKESNCDIKISDFIINNIRNHKLFYTQNHPTPYLFENISKQILDILKSYFSLNYDYIYTDKNLLCNGPKWPVCNSDITFWNFDYIKYPDENADEYYKELITMYYNYELNNNDGIPDVYY